MESGTGSIQNKLQFDNMVRELMREKIEMVSHARNGVGMASNQLRNRRFCDGDEGGVSSPYGTSKMSVLTP